MQKESVHDLVDQLVAASSDDVRRSKAESVKSAVNNLQQSLNSLENQLKDFYDAQFEHGGRSLDDYQRMVTSLNDQVKSYIDERIA